MLTKTTSPIYGPIPETFMIFDDNGNIWPPGFESELCRLGGPYSMLRTSEEARRTEAGKIGHQKALTHGTGWANGTMSPLSQKSADEQAARATRGGVPPEMRQRRFILRKGSVAAAVIDVLKRQPGERLTDKQLCAGTRHKPYELRQLLVFAVTARALNSELVPGSGTSRRYWV